MSNFISLKSIAANYDRATGVEGWTAQLSEDKTRVELVPPAGYVVVRDKSGASRIAKVDLSQVGEVYIVTGNCGSYYCGCAGGHLLAIAETQSAAKELLEQAKARPRFLGGAGKILELEPFSELSIDGPLAIGQLLERQYGP